MIRINRIAPLFVNLCFITLLLIPVLIVSVSAATIDCKKEFYEGYFTEFDPKIAKICQKKWKYLTSMEIKKMNDFYLNNQKK